MTALNTAIDGLDNKIAGKLQLELYAAVQNLLLDRIVWFLRNVDLTKGLADVVAHYRDGIAAVTAALDSVLSPDIGNARIARRQELVAAGVSDELGAAAWRSSRAHRRTRHRSRRRPHRKAGRRCGRHLFRRRHVLPAGPDRRRRKLNSDCRLFRPAGARSRSGFDRRRRTQAHRGHGRQRRGRRGIRAVEAWVAPRKSEVERIRSAIHEIANSGLTLSKLSVAASLLGDLVKN